LSKLESLVDLDPETGPNCYVESCPTRELLDHVFSRWGSLILGGLRVSRKRYSELRSKIGGVSEKMLAQTLRTLERDGLVVRHARPVVPPHVEYELTPLGRECAVRVAGLVGWIQSSIAEVTAAHKRYERARAKAR